MASEKLGRTVTAKPWSQPTYVANKGPQKIFKMYSVMVYSTFTDM